MAQVNILYFVLICTTTFYNSITTSAQSCTPQQCAAASDYALVAANHSTNNYIYLAGLFGVHDQGTNGYACGDINVERTQQLEAFLWAVNTFQSRYSQLNKLEGVSLGAIAFDTCSVPEKGVQQLLNLLNCELSFGTTPIDPDHIMAFIGPSTSREASLIGSLLSRMKRTLISPSASAAHLTQSDELGYFLRTVPSDSMQVDGMVELLSELDWRYIQVVYSEDDYGMEMRSLLMDALSTDGCIVNSMALPTERRTSDFASTIDAILESPETKIILLLLNTEDIKLLLQAATAENIEGDFIWVAGSTWGTNEDVVAGSEAASEGALTFALEHDGVIRLADFEDYFNDLVDDPMRNPWFSEYVATGGTTSLDVYSAYVIQAVDAALLGIHAALVDTCGQTALCGSLTNQWVMINDKIRSVNQDSVQFDADGEQLNAHLGVHRYNPPNSVNNDFYYRKIGAYTRSWLSVSSSTIPETSTACPTVPCAVCSESTSVPSTTTTTEPTTTPNSQASKSTKRNTNPPLKRRDEPWVIVLIVLAAVGILLVFIFEIFIMYKLSGSAIALRRLWLGQLLLFAIFLSYLCLFAFIPSPTDATCGIIRFGVGGCYAMICAILLVKLMIILSSKTIGYLKGIFQVLMFIFAMGVQIAIDIEWLLLRNPEAEYSHHEGGDEIWMCSQSFDNHVTTLAYIMFLLLVCTVLAAKANGIVTNHRESIYILISCCLIIPIFLAWVLLGVLKNDWAYEDPCLAFGLWATATIVLLVMFLPKLKQLSRGVTAEGVWSDDYSPDYTASIIPPSVAADYMGNSNMAYIETNHKPQVSPPIIYVDDVDLGLYSEPVDVKPQIHKVQDPDALYLKHPRTAHHMDTGSVRSMPVGLVHSAGASDVYNTRVLKVTGDLSGRGPYERRAQSEANFPIGYGTTRSTRSTRSARSVISARSSRPGDYNSLKRPRSIQDLGSL